MAKMFASLTPEHQAFLLRQHIFFTASAAASGHVNVSPKDVASFRVLGANRVAYLDQTGSGNETAAHLLADGRLTLMFCSLEGAPLILRLYGRGRVLLRGGDEFKTWLNTVFDGIEHVGTRQIIVLDVERVQTSCGYGVPLYSYVDERQTLRRWAEAKGEDGIRDYWRTRNAESIDGLPTRVSFSGEDNPT
jgi:pyridoxamine 5'-phosphate oxidase-like protein